MTDDVKVWQDLANAIVVQAATDWRNAVKRLRLDIYDIAARKMVTECNTFFKSGWCDLLSGGQGELILEKLRQEAVDDED